jgi:hypothetical protein
MDTTLTRAVFLSTLAALLLAAPDAWGSSPPPPRHSVVLETYAHAGQWQGRPLTVVSPMVFTRFGLSERLALEAGWTFAYASAPGGGAPPTLEAGNPFLGFNALLLSGPLTVRAGASLGLPFTLLSEPGALGTEGLLRAAAMRGNSGFGLFAPGLLSLVPGVALQWQQGRWSLGADLRTPLSLKFVGGQVQRADAVLQGTASAGLDLLRNLHVGSRFQAIYVTTVSEGGDPTQLALIPFARFHGSPGFLEARLTLNLDAPLGPAFSRAGVWSAGLAAGALF